MEPEVRGIIQDLYRALVDEVVAYVEVLDDGVSLSDRPDSRLTNPWLEYADQVQGEEWVTFELYQEEVERAVSGVVAKLSRFERALLWLDTEAMWNRNDDEPADDQIKSDGVTLEVTRRVGSRAADWELPPRRSERD